MSRIAIIPARGGSQRVHRKNIKPFRGRPIIDYSIETARKSGLFSRIFVSTDDHEIAVQAASQWAEVFMREPDDGTKGTQEVARDVIERLPDATEVCVLYATSPLLDVESLVEGFKALEDHDFTVSVDQHGRDAGCFYWGRAQAFLERRALDTDRVIGVRLPEGRVCDINTLEDWQRAEQLFDALRRAE